MTRVPASRCRPIPQRLFFRTSLVVIAALCSLMMTDAVSADGTPFPSMPAADTDVTSFTNNNNSNNNSASLSNSSSTPSAAGVDPSVQVSDGAPSVPAVPGGPSAATPMASAPTGLQDTPGGAGAASQSPSAAVSVAQTGGPPATAGGAPQNPSAAFSVSANPAGLPSAASGGAAAATPSPTALVPPVAQTSLSGASAGGAEASASPTALVPPAGTGVPSAGGQGASLSPSAAAVSASAVPTGVPGTPAGGSGTDQGQSAAASVAQTGVPITAMVSISVVPTGLTGTPAPGSQGDQGGQGGPSPSAGASVAQTGVPNSAAMSQAGSVPSALVPGSLGPTGVMTTAGGGAAPSQFPSALPSAVGSQQVTSSIAPATALSTAVSSAQNVLHIQLSGAMQASDSMQPSGGGGVTGSMQPSGGSGVTYSSLAPQLAGICGGIPMTRISNVTLQQSPVGSATVLRFDILDGVPSNEAAAAALDSLVVNTNVVLAVKETGAALVLSHQLVSWTDGGACPSAPCAPDGGRCTASLASGALSCSCFPDHGGPQCAQWTGARPLLGLVVIPIVVGLVLIGLGIGLLVRWTRRRDGHEFPRMKKDLFKDVDSNYGSVSTVSELGARNKAYTTISSRSYAMPIDDAVLSYSNTDDKSSSLF